MLIYMLSIANHLYGVEKKLDKKLKKYKSKIELYPWGTPTLVFGTPDII